MPRHTNRVDCSVRLTVAQILFSGIERLERKRTKNAGENTARTSVCRSGNHGEGGATRKLRGCLSIYFLIGCRNGRNARTGVMNDQSEMIAMREHILEKVDACASLDKRRVRAAKVSGILQCLLVTL
jgi:hypothetical protein